MEFMDLLDEYLELRRLQLLSREEDWRSIPKISEDTERMFELREELDKRARGEL